MNLNIDIHTLIARLRGFGKTGKRFVLVSPAREWFTGCVVGVLLFLGGGMYAGWWFYHAVKNVDAGFVTAEERRPSYVHAQVEEVVHMYEERVRAFESLVTQGADISQATTTSVVEEETAEPQIESEVVAEPSLN